MPCFTAHSTPSTRSSCMVPANSPMAARVKLDAALGVTRQAEAVSRGRADRAEAAERAARLRLFEAKLNEARATRLSQRLGQRSDSLTVVAEGVEDEKADALLRDALDRLSVKEAVAEAAALTGAPRRLIYQRALALRGD